MKVVFLLDNREYVEVAPDKLQIRQIDEANGIAALGTEVTVPVTKEDGTPELNEDGTPKTQVGFRPFINYNVRLTVPTPAVAPVGRREEPVAVDAKPVKKASKRRAN